MGTAEQVDGLAGALLQFVEAPAQVATLHVVLDRYCHRLRNRLNSMKLSLYLAHRLAGDSCGLDWRTAEASYRSMEALIERIQMIAAPMRLAPLSMSLTDWIEQRLPDWRRSLGDRPIELVGDGPGEPASGCFDPARLGQALDLLIDSWASSGPEGGRLRLEWGRDRERFFLNVNAEGPGEPWLVATRGSTESLALPLLARVISAHGGELSIDGPLRPLIGLSWPLEASTAPIDIEPST